jgi:hypothetical protein
MLYLAPAEDAGRITLLDTFGALIANSDRHFDNVTLFDRHAGPFALAPAYDMLPMLYAPQEGQLVERTFTPPGPTAATLAVWPRARDIAQSYWERLSADPRISSEFRAHSARCLQAMSALTPRGAPRPTGL